MSNTDADGAYSYTTRRTSIHAAELEFNGETWFATGISHWFLAGRCQISINRNKENIIGYAADIHLVNGCVCPGDGSGATQCR
ncbi:hypothetical protein [Mucilaginibacter rubeus]|uniref:hypothetical protein n=1 Tax=Mucilaginibacter rubeus TaxID=2027860 RepID=UPI00339805D0